MEKAKDLANMILGLWMAISPWALGVDTSLEPNILYNCVLTGVLVAVFAGWAAASPRKWREYVLVLLGFWLLIAPVTFTYRSSVALWNDALIGLGVAIVALARLGDHEELAG